jgi:hypothetical protein
MKKALVAAAMGALGLAACQQDGSWPEAVEQTGSTSEGAELATTSPTLTTSVSKLQPTAARVVQACTGGDNPLDIHLAALGTLVLKCKGSIGPKDFVIELDKRYPKYPVLRPTFTCPDEKVFRDIDNLLGLQLIEGATAHTYFTRQWRAFLRRYEAAGSPQCPNWEHLNEENAPSYDTVKAAQANPEIKPKSHDDWQLRNTEPRCQDPQCLVTNAQLCTSWLGSRFWEAADVEKGVVKTDPSWWKDNTNYGDPDFFDQLSWIHLMAESTGWPPGDLYGAPARWGEGCTFYALDMVTKVTGQLYPVECSPGWWCVTQCKASAIPPAPAPVPAY